MYCCFQKHSSERPYTCDLCQKTFSRNHNLMTHMWIHNQEKQHTCQICAKTFTYYSNLQVELFICTTTSYLEPSSRGLYSYIQNHTPSLMNNSSLHTAVRLVLMITSSFSSILTFMALTSTKLLSFCRHE